MPRCAALEAFRRRCIEGQYYVIHISNHAAGEIRKKHQSHLSFHIYIHTLFLFLFFFFLFFRNNYRWVFHFWVNLLRYVTSFQDEVASTTMPPSSRRTGNARLVAFDHRIACASLCCVCKSIWHATVSRYYYIVYYSISKRWSARNFTFVHQTKRGHSATHASDRQSP